MKDLPELVADIVEATKKHEQYRDKECINMIASEGIKSPAVNQMLDLSHDLAARYAEGENDAQGHVKKRYYQGQKYMSQIEDLATDIMKSLFKSTWADVRLVSGTHANLATFKGLSLASKNNKMVVTPLSCGAHISHDYTGLAGNVLGIREHQSRLQHRRIQHRPRQISIRYPRCKTRHRHLRRQPLSVPTPNKRAKRGMRRSWCIRSLRRFTRFRFDCRWRIPRPTPRRRRLHHLINPQNIPRSTRRSHHGQPNHSRIGKSSEENPVRNFPAQCLKHPSGQTASSGHRRVGNESFRLTISKTNRQKRPNRRSVPVRKRRQSPR